MSFIFKWVFFWFFPICYVYGLELKSSHYLDTIATVHLPGAYCTGALIGPDTLITAAHCVYNRKHKTFFNPNQIRVTFNTSENAPIRVSAMTYTIGTMDIQKRTFDEDILKNDWAIIKLSNAVGCDLDWLRMSRKELVTDDHVNVAINHHSGNNIIHECKMALSSQPHPALRLKGCQSNHGDSGAPVLIKEGAHFLLRGVISAGGNDSKDRYRIISAPSEMFFEKAKAMAGSCPETQHHLLSLGD